MAMLKVFFEEKNQQTRKKNHEKITQHAKIENNWMKIKLRLFILGIGNLRKCISLCVGNTLKKFERKKMIY